MQNMKTQQVLSYIHTTMSNPDLDELSGRAWCLFFKAPDVNFYVAYDSKNPIETYNAIAPKHPDYEFIGMRAVDSQATAIEYAKALRLSAKLLAWLKRHEEMNDAIKAPSALPASPTYRQKPSGAPAASAA